MNRSRRKYKGRTDSGGFFQLPHAVMDSPNFGALSGSAVKLLTALGRQYCGTNNGDLSAAWRIMKPHGWRSRDTLQRAQRELLEAGMIEKTRQGGLHKCNLFALTWRAVDDCGGKLEVPSTHVASGLWRLPDQNRIASTDSVSIKHGFRVNSTKAA